MIEQDIYEAAIQLVAKARGKLEVCCKVGAANLEELSIAYTPGVAAPTRAVAADKSLQDQYTARASMLAIVTDGTAVLGLGNVGPEAAMVVIEGKGVMLKHFAGVDPVPLCLNTTDPEQIISIIKAIEPSFGFIFLEDIAAPRCFAIEERLGRELNIPVFHDDQSARDSHCHLCWPDQCGTAFWRAFGLQTGRDQRGWRLSHSHSKPSF